MAERFWKTRRAVRLLVINQPAVPPVLPESVLLLLDSDPGVPNSRWWVPPGGGIEAGETEQQAAVRELREEIGLVIVEQQLVGPVARRRVIHGFSDRILVQHETFYLIRTPLFQLSEAGRTARERVTLRGDAWIPIATLPQLTRPLWPANLPMLLSHAATSRTVLELGDVEESTVPVA